MRRCCSSDRLLQGCGEHRRQHFYDGSKQHSRCVGVHTTACAPTRQESRSTCRAESMHVCTDAEGKHCRWACADTIKPPHCIEHRWQMRRKLPDRRLQKQRHWNKRLCRWSSLRRSSNAYWLNGIFASCMLSLGACKCWHACQETPHTCAHVLVQRYEAAQCQRAATTNWPCMHCVLCL
jgi:hypothetical protein